MAFSITDLSGYSPEEYPLYFFDANVWIAVLKHSGSQSIKPSEKVYVDFFEAVITLNNGPARLLKKLKNVPKLVVTSMLLSEIINAYMRRVAFVAYSKGKTGLEFKRDYRPSADYRQQLLTITSDIQAYRDYIELRDDDFGSTHPFEMLSLMQSNPGRYDFNDLFYYRSLRNKSIAIVTDDGDFVFENIPVLTANTKLIQSGRTEK